MRYGDTEDIKRNLDLFYKTRIHSYLDQALKMSRDLEKEKIRKKHEQRSMDQAKSK